MQYAKPHKLPNSRFFVDDGISGTTFERNGFKEMQALAEAGQVGIIVVKDLSRFGRNYLEVGKYLEITYPTLGIRFIAIQENVDTSQNGGTEMMPFHNIFNEWYAAQTSKKIKSKADRGERVLSTVPYGYKKDKSNPKQWVIDEPAAEIVRYIYQLYLDGLRVSQIVKRLHQEKIPSPTAYFTSIGRPTFNKPSDDPYNWCSDTIRRILDNQQYTGCTVNFKSTFVSYKVHKVVHNPESEWQIIPNTQEAIIDEATWERVHELRKHRRRNNATGRESIFSGLVYCADCGSKLYFCAAKSINEKQEFYRCAAYKENTGTCSIHYIRVLYSVSLFWKRFKRLQNLCKALNPYLYIFLQRKMLNAERKISVL